MSEVTPKKQRPVLANRLTLAIVGLVALGTLGSVLVGTQLPGLVRFADLDDLASRLGFLRVAFLAVSGVVAVTALVVWAFLIRPLSGRLGAIVRASDALANGQVLPPIGDTGDDEVAQVANSIDDLARAITIDIESRQTSEDELRRQAAFDELTGAANRSSLMIALNKTLEDKDAADHSALLSIDLDKFKELNDTYGHQAGDEALKVVTERLRSAVKGSDVVARMGGDEFLVLLHHVTPAEVAEVVARLRASMGREATILGRRHKLLFSIGTAQIGHGVDSEFLLREVDIAMYQDKERNRRLRDQAKVSSQDEVNDVLGDGHLDIRFQPIFQTAIGRVVGASAQPHWVNITGGELAPDQFRTMIDETPQGVAFDQAAIGETLAHVQSFAYNHVLPDNFLVLFRPTIATLSEPSFPQWLQAVLLKRGLPASMLQLVIGASAIENDPAGLRALRQIGIRMVVDDVGLLALQDDRLGQLEMILAMLPERRVRDFRRNQLSRPAAVALLDLARTANLTIMAEGVDEREHLAELESLGVVFASGSHLAPPVQADQFRRGLTAQAHQDAAAQQPPRAA